MKKSILFSVILLKNFLCLTAQTWQLVGTQGFTPPVTQYSLTTLTIDQNGAPYVAFADASNSGKLSVMKFDGSSWGYVGNANFSAGQAYDISIAIDNNNLPWVAFGDTGTTSNATVMKFNGTTWVTVGTPGFSNGVVNNCTIKFDGSYTPYVAYVDNYYSGKAVVKKFNGSSWVNIGTPGFTAGGTGQMTMALNRNGVPYVGYQDQQNGFAESVMMYNGSNWVHVGAATFSNGTCQFTHITFDTSGLTPYVCYNEGYGTFAPNVQMFNGSSWQYVGGQNFNTDQDYQNNIAIDGNNTPYVIFPDWVYSGKAAVMKYNGASWVQVGNIAFSSGEIWYPNIATDAWNNVYVEFYDDGNSDKISVMKFGNFGPAPVAAKFAGNDTVICQSSSVTFTDQSIGSPDTWHWVFDGGNPQFSNSESPTVVYDTPGIYNVKLVVSHAGAIDSLTKAAYINVSAAALTGAISAMPDTICSGSSVQLNTAGSAGNLQWQSSGTNSNFQNINDATDSIVTTSPLANSIYFRLVAVNGICHDTSGSRMIIVNDPPSPPVLSASDSIICSSDSALIQSSGTYLSYEWSSGDTGTYIYVKSAGGYWVTVTDANGCTAASNHQNILVYPAPFVSIAASGDTLFSHNATMYQWYNDAGFIPGATDSLYIVSETGNYSVQITDTNGCTAKSNAQHVVITGNEAIRYNTTVDIYPNPFSSDIAIAIQKQGLSEVGFTITNILGQQLFYMKESNLSNSYTKALDLSFLPEGIYLLEIETAREKVIKQIVKQ